MESSLVILHLFFFVGVYTTIHETDTDNRPLSQQSACPVTLPGVDHADISSTSLKSNYSEGDKLLYICQQGYVTLRRIIYVCEGHQWVSAPNVKCSPKRCELPADIPNGYYIKLNGTDFVFGTTIKYICKEGYQMVSRVNTRTCLAGGWDNRLPVCEEVLCSPPQLEDNIAVDGLTDYGDPLRLGHKLQIACDSPRLKLVGPREITCHENGEWTSPSPRCEEITCELKEISNTVSVLGLPEPNTSAKYGHRLQFYCTDSELYLRGNQEVTCSTDGNWSSPFPVCEEIFCKIGQLNNVKIISGTPSTVPPFKPGHRLNFQCRHSSLIMLGLSSITCHRDGNWNSPLPTCLVNSGCGAPPHIEFAETTTLRNTYYSPEETVEYICPNYYTIDGNPYMTCTLGKWKGSLRCLKPCTLTISDMNANKIEQKYGPKRLMYSRHEQFISFKCQHGKKPASYSVGLRQQCIDGIMRLPVCQ